ncbi:hypothetical protein SAMN05216262_101172 [Colwellia chukchiensis]|uniref:Uncharacterized protein n=1 Tax=Colwellia chukchiensis TaxID=641665 RepID=A0A1H7GFY1_9GAMM|nr:hypothetical protein [Colwellia chukchiensis]SEK36447.1 hypothetical protein SAMN05216262_101172 [Colwellia chukchiensis]
MTALQKQRRVSKDINLVYDLREKDNLTQLTAQEDRAVIAQLKANLVLPNNKVLTVGIDFDSTSGYHDNAIMVMDDFGVELIATAFEVKYGKEHADNVRRAWNNKQTENSPRKPSYLLVQKPGQDDQVPNVYAVCGEERHPPKEAPASIS